MSEAANFFLLQLTLLGVVLIMHTYIGLHIVRRTLIFSDLALDQLAAFGALVGIGIGIRYGTAESYVVSLFFVLVGATLLALLNPKNRRIPREAVIGVVYAMALVASLLLGDKLPRGGECVRETLVGKMSWIGWDLVYVTVAAYVVLLVFHYVFRRKFIDLAEQKEVTASTKFWDFLLFTTQGIVTVLIVPIAGVLLAYAFLMIPATIAAMFTKGWGKAVLLGWSAGFGACVIGIFGAYRYELPYGPSLVLVLGAFFVLAVLIRGLAWRKKRTGEGSVQP